MAEMNTNTHSQQDVATVIKDQVSTALGQVVSAWEPQINEYANRFADQAVDKGKDLAQSAFQAARRQPWYLVGAAAFLLVGAAIVLGFGAKEAMES